VGESGLVVLVPEAESLVGVLRLRHDESARLGVPAHITVLFPFMEPSFISAEITRTCAQIVAAHAAFSFKLVSVGRFPATAFLAPHPSEPFIALTEAFARAFPAFAPFRGEFSSIVPHLTVAHGSVAAAEVVAGALAEALAATEPVSAVCSSVALMENSSGRWSTTHVFPLASESCT
jgi:2'-5' RNA ligase